MNSGREELRRSGEGFDRPSNSLLEAWRMRPLLLKNGGEYVIVAPDEIKYIESKGRKVCLHVVGLEDLVSCYFAIGRLRLFLPESFARCHKSYLVNLAYVFKFLGDRLLLRTGETVPVSQRCRAELLARISQYARSVGS